MASEFKAFVQRGNVVDMAVGVVIGGAFGKIVSSVVSDLLMPPIGLLIGGVSFKDLKIAIGGKPEAPVTLNYGVLFQTVFDFLVIAICVFVVVKAVNSLKKPALAAPAAPSEPPKQEQLLTEIRDLLKKQRPGSDGRTGFPIRCPTSPFRGRFTSSGAYRHRKGNFRTPLFSRFLCFHQCVREGIPGTEPNAMDIRSR